MPEHRGQRRRGVGGVDGGQLVQQRLHTAFGHRLLVHEAGVQVADALRVGGRCGHSVRCRRRGGSGDQVADLLLGAVVQRPERTVGGAVAGHLVVGQPAAVDMAEQVVLRAGIGVDVAQVDTGLIVAAAPPRMASTVTPPGCQKVAPAAWVSPPGTLTRMPDDEPTPDDSDDGSVFTGYGIASAVLGVIAVAAVVLAALIWTQHRGDADELRYRTRAMQAAADWTSVLINMNKDTVEASMAKLHEGTVGQLNADFDAAVSRTASWSRQLQSRTTGQVDSVAVESIHHEQPGRTARPPPPSPSWPRSPRAPTPCWWWPRRSARTPAATSRRPCAGRCGWTSPTSTASLLISRLEPIR